MNFYSHRTVGEQKNRLPRAFQANYEVTQLDRIKLFDGNEVVEIQGYFEYSFLEEKSYVEQPTRAIDGSIANIDDYVTFLTPRIIIKYNMMHIDDYRMLMRKIKENNGIVVMCYDVVEDKIVKHEMYFAPPSMPMIYQKYLMALGIQEYSIELIGTNYNTKMPFLIDGTQYETNRGMTWEEWLFSDLCGNIDLVINGDFIQKVGTDSKVISSRGSFVKPNDFILKNENYRVW